MLLRVYPRLAPNPKPNIFLSLVLGPGLVPYRNGIACRSGRLNLNFQVSPERDAVGHDWPTVVGLIGWQ